MTHLRAAPPPAPDELLASWIGRLACLYEAPPASLWQELIGPDLVRGGPSIDLLTSVELARVAAAARLNAGALAATTVEAMLPAAPATWLRARGVSLSGVPWCPACLQDDRGHGRVPHLRRLWAVACVAVCRRHRVPLTDVCPVCIDHTCAGFRWGRTQPVLVCTTCDTDLAGGGTTGAASLGDIRADEPPAAITAVARVQARLLRALRARRPAPGSHHHAAPDALIDAVNALAGHLLVQLGIARPSPGVGAAEPPERCRLDQLSAQNVFVVLAALAALPAWPAAHEQRRRQLAERILADPAAAARLAAARTPAEWRRVIGHLARAALDAEEATRAAPPGAAGS